jgi:hypothetical protein
MPHKVSTGDPVCLAKTDTEDTTLTLFSCLLLCVTGWRVCLSTVVTVNNATAKKESEAAQVTYVTKQQQQKVHDTLQLTHQHVFTVVHLKVLEVLEVERQCPQTVRLHLTTLADRRVCCRQRVHRARHGPLSLQ